MLNTREKLLEWKLFDAKSAVCEQTVVGRAAQAHSPHVICKSEDLRGQTDSTKAGREVLQLNVAINVRQCRLAAEIF